MIDKITPDLVKGTILKLKNHKNDAVYDWRSDALKVGADSLADPICDLLRALLIHGHVPKIFLMCSLVPIVKDNNESKLTSSNYRLIAISSLILKLFLILITVALYSSIVAGTLVLQQELFLRRGHR